MIERKDIIILVDFANLEMSTLEDVTSIIEHITAKLLDQLPPQPPNIFFEVLVRLYGGWYEEKNLTKLAQDLTVILQDKYPDFNDKLNCKISVELTRALAARPANDMVRTFRKRQGLSRLKICRIDDACCDPAKAFVRSLRKIKRKKQCPDCQSPAHKLLWHDEQKLVDVMLAMDISFYALNESDAELAVVSSDDDFIPAMFQVATLGKQIFHIHAKSNGATHEDYRRIAPVEKYVEITF